MDEKRTKVRHWMKHDVNAIDATASITEALLLLRGRKVRRVPVLLGRRLVGVVTERMLLAYAPAKNSTLYGWEMQHVLARTPVTRAMNPRPHCVQPDTSLAACAALIREQKLSGVSVVDESRNLLGVLTMDDVLAALVWFAEQAEETRSDLAPVREPPGRAA
jgi:acetoin utilization protein AcuB